MCLVESKQGKNGVAKFEVELTLVNSRNFLIHKFLDS